ncbi:MAG: hypothetical protein AUI14_17020 [Actinobacteria bacterium 13_2_20CM_2_71_6]|nr:MAG: hypothetical protein AUI14_17020 [Actinobacteria bacterium 13_2_20CM_2_71_6]
MTIDRKRAAVLVAVAAVVVVAGLIWALWYGDSSAPPRAGATPTGTPTAAPPTGGNRSAGGPGGAAPSTGGNGSVAGDAAGGFLAELDAIAPGLAADRDHALQAGHATCAELKAGRSPDTVVQDAMRLFRVADVVLDKPRATLVVDAARNHLCPG